MFERLVADAMGRRELLQEFPTMKERIARRGELDGIVQDWVGTRTARETLAALDAAEVPCGPVNSVRDLFDDPQVKARNDIVEFPSPLGGMLAMAGIVPKLSATPGTVESTGPVEIGRASCRERVSRCV